MPKLWNETVDAHRLAVRNATLDATARLAGRHGVTSVTMSDIAKEAGIGRATLYKYFADLPAVLVAWHERYVEAHLQQLHRVFHTRAPALERLEQVLGVYASTSYRHHRQELAAMLHAGDHARLASQHLLAMLTEVIQQSVEAGDIRSDIPAGELAVFCLSAAEGAARLQSVEAVDRLVTTTLSALRP